MRKFFLILLCLWLPLSGLYAAENEEKKQSEPEEVSIFDFFHDSVLPENERALVKAWQIYFWEMEGWNCSIEMERVGVFLDAKSLEFSTLHRATVICISRNQEGKKISSNPVVYMIAGKWGYFFSGSIENGKWELIRRVKEPIEEDQKLKGPEEGENQPEDGESL